MNSFFVMLGIESWKPAITALLLPPVPLLVLTLIGGRLLLPRRGLGWLLIIVSVVLLWISSCSGAARGLTQLMLRPPAALSFDRVRELRAEVAAKRPLAIVVLGGMGSIVGVAVAAVAMIGGIESLRELTVLKQVFGQDFEPTQYRMLLFGLAMVLIMLWKPRGFVTAREPTAFLKERRQISGSLTKEGHG